MIDFEELKQKRNTELLLDNLELNNYRYIEEEKIYICKYKNMSFRFPLLEHSLNIAEMDILTKKLKQMLRILYEQENTN